MFRKFLRSAKLKDLKHLVAKTILNQVIQCHSRLTTTLFFLYES
jgi:hypothetical protein